LTIVVSVNVNMQPYGNPGSIGEPLGIWAGEANVLGDASGGRIQVVFRPAEPAGSPTLDDQRRQYVWFTDGAQVLANTDMGDVSTQVFTHWARANSALGARFGHVKVVASRTNGVVFVPSEDLLNDRVPRMPQFWDSQELAVGGVALLQLQVTINTDTQNYEFRCYGRYYDKQLLTNRAFGRLVMPVGVSQFEG